MNRHRWWSFPLHYQLVVVVAFLLLIGIAMLVSTTVVPSSKTDAGPYGIAKKELAIIGVGLVAAFIASRIPYERRRWLITPVTILAIAFMFVPWLFQMQVNDTWRWIRIGGFSLQPSEFVRLLLPLSISLFFLPYEQAKASVKEDDLYPLLLLGLATFAMIVNSDAEGTLLMALVGMIPLVLAGMNRRRIASLVLVGVLMTLFLLLRGGTGGHRASRIQVWWNPSLDDSTSQVSLGLQAFNRGGLFGVGPGASQGTWNEIPNASSDFVFPVIGEEYGLVGAALVIAAYLAILYIGYAIWLRHPNIFGRLAGFSLTTGLVTQAFINMGSTVRLLPVTGLTLPLISTGGSSKLAVLITFGVLYRLCKACEHPSETTTLREPVGQLEGEG